jgi:hypothetical protein
MMKGYCNKLIRDYEKKCEKAKQKTYYKNICVSPKSNDLSNNQNFYEYFNKLKEQYETIVPCAISREKHYQECIKDLDLEEDESHENVRKYFNKASLICDNLYNTYLPKYKDVENKLYVETQPPIPEVITPTITYKTKKLKPKPKPTSKTKTRKQKIIKQTKFVQDIDLDFLEEQIQLVNKERLKQLDDIIMKNKNYSLSIKKSIRIPNELKKIIAVLKYLTIKKRLFQYIYLFLYMSDKSVIDTLNSYNYYDLEELVEDLKTHINVQKQSFLNLLKEINIEDDVFVKTMDVISTEGDDLFELSDEKIALYFNFYKFLFEIQDNIELDFLNFMKTKSAKPNEIDKVKEIKEFIENIDADDVIQDNIFDIYEPSFIENKFRRVLNNPNDLYSYLIINLNTIFELRNLQYQFEVILTDKDFIVGINKKDKIIYDMLKTYNSITIIDREDKKQYFYFSLDNIKNILSSLIDTE